MLAAAVRLELRFPVSHSLKEKRRILKPFVEGLRQLLSVSVAEVDHHDDWQRATVGLALVAVDGGRLDHLIERIRHYVDKNMEVEVLEMVVSYLEEPA